MSSTANAAPVENKLVEAGKTSQGSKNLLKMATASFRKPRLSTGWIKLRTAILRGGIKVVPTRLQWEEVTTTWATLVQAHTLVTKNPKKAVPEIRDILDGVVRLYLGKNSPASSKTARGKTTLQRLEKFRKRARLEAREQHYMEKLVAMVGIKDYNAIAFNQGAVQLYWVDAAQIIMNLLVNPTTIPQEQSKQMAQLPRLFTSQGDAKKHIVPTISSTTLDSSSSSSTISPIHSEPAPVTTTAPPPAPAIVTPTASPARTDTSEVSTPSVVEVVEEEVTAAVQHVEEAAATATTQVQTVVEEAREVITAAIDNATHVAQTAREEVEEIVEEVKAAAATATATTATIVEEVSTAATATTTAVVDKVVATTKEAAAVVVEKSKSWEVPKVVKDSSTATKVVVVLGSVGVVAMLVGLAKRRHR